MSLYIERARALMQRICHREENRDKERVLVLGRCLPYGW